MEGIQVSTETLGSQNQISVIKVGGYIDTTTSSEVERALSHLIKQGRYQIIIDLGNVDYISSAGWGIFISEIKAIRESNGDLKLVQMIPDVYEIFELLEFHHILDVYETVDEAIQKFEASHAVEVVSEAAAGQPSGSTESLAESKAESKSESAEAAPPAPEISEPELPAYLQEPEEEERALVPLGRSPKRLNLIDRVNMPVEEKIKHIVANYPDSGAWGIRRRLNSPEFGFVRIGWFKTRSLLRKLELNNRQKRRAFALTKP